MRKIREILTHRYTHGLSLEKTALAGRENKGLCLKHLCTFQSFLFEFAITARPITVQSLERYYYTLTNCCWTTSTYTTYHNGLISFNTDKNKDTDALEPSELVVFRIYRT